MIWKIILLVLAAVVAIVVVIVLVIWRKINKLDIGSTIFSELSEDDFKEKE